MSSIFRNIESGEGQLQIHLTTKQKQFAVPDIPYSVPANISIQDLNTLLNTLLKENVAVCDGAFEFDFLVKGEFLKYNLGKHLRDRDVSFEDIIEIEYVERYPAPEPQDCLIHDDWVSAVKANDKYILTGCYDNSINIWTLKGEHKLTVSGHSAPIKGVAWISMNDDTAVFASASKDQTIMIWEWDLKNKADCLFVCKGHERAIDCIDVSPDGRKLASGSWDNLLKVWSAQAHDSDEATNQKRARSEEGNSRTPLITLEGHREAISAVQWIDNSTIVTSSWDHTLKFWDLSLNGITKEIPGNKSFFDFHYSTLNGLIITASADKNLKLYDPRSTQGSVVKSTYLGHTQWVQSVRWSKTEEYLFISGAYDNQVKLWDYRSPKAPLFDLMGHEDKVLAVDWTNPKFMISGGSDNSLRIFKSKKVVEE